MWKLHCRKPDEVVISVFSKVITCQWRSPSNGSAWSKMKSISDSLVKKLWIAVYGVPNPLEASSCSAVLYDAHLMLPNVRDQRRRAVGAPLAAQSFGSRLHCVQAA